MTARASIAAFCSHLGRVVVLLVVTTGSALLGANEPERGFFGLTPRLTNEGVIVVGVTPGGPAEAAGVREGDLVVLLDGKPPSVTPEGGVMDAFTRYRAGDTVEIAVRRKGEIHTFLVALAAVPPPTREDQERAEAINRKIRAAAVVDQMFKTLDVFELSFSKEGRLLFRETPEEDWEVLEPEVADVFEAVTRHLLKEKKETVLRLRVERPEGEEPRLVVVER